MCASTDCSGRRFPGSTDSRPDAQVYSTVTSDDGKTADPDGRRQTSAAQCCRPGAANVTATYRVGAGLAGPRRRRRPHDAARPAAGTDQRHQSAARRRRRRSGNARHDPAERAAHRAHLRSRGLAAGFRGSHHRVGRSRKGARPSGFGTVSPAVYLTVAGQAGGTFSDPAAWPPTSARRAIPTSGCWSATSESADSVGCDRAGVAAIRCRTTSWPLCAPRCSRRSRSTPRVSGQPIHLSAMYAVMQAVAGVAARRHRQLGFVQPDGMSAADFTCTSTAARCERLAGRKRGAGAGLPAHFLRRVRTPARPGKVLPAELAWIETPART